MAFWFEKRQGFSAGTSWKWGRILQAFEAESVKSAEGFQVEGSEWRIDNILKVQVPTTAGLRQIYNLMRLIIPLEIKLRRLFWETIKKMMNIVL